VGKADRHIVTCEPIVWNGDLQPGVRLTPWVREDLTGHVKLNQNIIS
jgi:hypothetical protein